MTKQTNNICPDCGKKTVTEQFLRINIIRETPDGRRYPQPDFISYSKWCLCGYRGPEISEEERVQAQ